SGPPSWAKSMKQRQSLGHSASLAAHTVRAGDGHGAGASIDTQEKD
ncbi:MAG TPA: P-type conjugative transfer protein TrbL, partial [Erythrobacter sp.]|nr:P-type conjugative transfer protein TrbL [Erythrobacter sp.]